MHIIFCFGFFSRGWWPYIHTYIYISIRVCKLFQVYLYLSVYIDMFFLFTDACFYAWMMLSLWIKSMALLDVMICCFVSFGSGPMCLAGLFLTRLTWCESVLASWFVTIHYQVYGLHTMRMRKKTSNKHKPFWIGWGLLMLWVCLDLSCVMSLGQRSCWKTKSRNHPNQHSLNCGWNPGVFLWLGSPILLQTSFKRLSTKRELLMIPSENLGTIGREACVQLFPKCCPRIAALPNK